jgi:hypothetical protein
MNNHRSIWIEKYANFVVFSIFFCTIGFIVGVLFVNNQLSSNASVQYVSDIAMEEAIYLRLVYIGSSNCGFSNNENAHEIVRELKDYFQLFAHKNGYKFLSTGVALDLNAEQGIAFLEKSGPYDEIISGIGWFNLGAHQYIWNTLPGYGSTPQILLTTTKFNPIIFGERLANIEQADQLLERISGIHEIKKFLKSTKTVPTEEIVENLGL